MANAVTRSGAARSEAWETTLRTLLWLLLGGWVGSWAAFGLVVAPTVFREIPDVAGRLIGPVLGALHLYGGAAGLLLALVGMGLSRSRLLVGLPLVMGLVCLISHFGVSGAIAEARDGAFGPAGTEAAASRFRQLHQISMGLYLAVSAAAVLLVGLHARADARRA